MLSEVVDQRPERPHQPQLVQKWRAKIVGDRSNAPDPFLEQLTGTSQPLGEGLRAVVLHRGQLEVERSQDLCRLVVQLSGEPCPLLFVLVHHGRREPLHVGRPNLKPSRQIGVLQRRADLLSQCD